MTGNCSGIPPAQAAGAGRSGGGEVKTERDIMEQMSKKKKMKGNYKEGRRWRDRLVSLHAQTNG